MRNLKTYSELVDFKYESRLSSAGAVFFPVKYPIKKLKRFKKYGGKIIQRLDGIYYPSKHGSKYLDLNSEIKEIYLDLADHIVFQSDYSRKQCFEMFGEIPNEKYSLIINGVDRTLFKEKPVKEIKQIEKFRLVSTGNFRNIDMLEPVIKALDGLSVSFQLDLIGPVVNDSLKVYLDRPYVNYLGAMNSQSIADILPMYDIFIYSHLNPPCPNSVLEAVACGMPVVGYDSGGMKELLPFSTELLAEVSDDLFQMYYDFKPEKLKDKIELCMNDYPFWKKKALENGTVHDFKNCGEKYLDLFKRFSSHQMPKRTFFGISW